MEGFTLKLLRGSALAVESSPWKRKPLPQSALGLTMPTLLAPGQCTTWGGWSDQERLHNSLGCGYWRAEMGITP